MKGCKRKDRDDDKHCGNASKMNSKHGASAKHSKTSGASKINNKALHNNAVNSKKDEPEKVIAGGREIEVSNTPLATLIRAAASINPKQFELPYEMTLPSNFPGEPKGILTN